MHYACHPIVCFHDIDSALEMIAIDFSASRQPSELLKLVKYFTILKCEIAKKNPNWMKVRKPLRFEMSCQLRLLTNSPIDGFHRDVVKF